jgi:hypothetical protein
MAHPQQVNVPTSAQQAGAAAMAAAAMAGAMSGAGLPAGMMIHPSGMVTMPHMQHMQHMAHLPPHMQMGMAHPAMGLLRAPHMPGNLHTFAYYVHQI